MLGKRSSSLLDVIGSMRKAGLTHKPTQAGLHTIGSNNWLKNVPQFCFYIDNTCLLVLPTDALLTIKAVMRSVATTEA